MAGCLSILLVFFLDTTQLRTKQVAYKQGINPLKDWTMATDEAHSTKFTIKGLKEGEKYFVKVRREKRGGTD